MGYAYDLLGNRTRLTYPDGKVVSYTYDADNRLSTVTDWLSGTTRYEYDLAGRLITTTLPNGVVSTQQYDDANRLTNLRYEQDDGTTVAQYGYQLNDLGFREVVTETIYIPEVVDEVRAFIEQNGLLVMEAEHGQGNGDATTHTWAETVVLPDYSGDSYLQALPDIGQRYNTNNVDVSPQRSYLMSITNAADYTLWVRGMAADPAGDSFHVGLNGNVLADATKLTGFAPREWSWTAVTMDNLTATVNLTSTSLYTLDLWMREDGLRIDQLVLTDDPDYTPTSTLAESPYDLVNSNATAGHLSTWTIDYDYDPLRRLTNATYSGDISATFAYDYDPVGNMTAYTETIAFDSQETQTKQVVRYFDDANKMIASTDSELGTTSYHYDDNGNLIEILPPISSEQQPVRYTYDQRNLLLTSAVDNGNGSFASRTTYVYDGNGQRISLIDYGTIIGQTPATTTFTNDISGLSQVLMSDDGATQTAMLYGRDLIGSSSSDTLTEMNISLADGLGSARIEMVDADIIQATTYGPYGNVFHTVGEAGTVYGFTGEETDPTGLIYLRARYYNPALRTFMSRDPFNGYRDRPQSQNGYTYVEANPVNYIDPTGEFAELIALYATIETAFDIYVFYQDLRVVLFDFQNPECGNLTADLIALGLDGLALIPFISSTMDDVGGLFARADDAPTVSRILNEGDAAFGLPTTTEEFLDWRYGYSQAMNATDTHVFGRFGDIKANFDIPASVNNLDAIEGSRVLNVGDDWTPAVNRGYVDAAADAAIIENRPIILVSDPTDLVGTYGTYNEELGVWSNSITSHELAIFDSYGFTKIPGSDGNWLLLPPNFH